MTYHNCKCFVVLWDVGMVCWAGRSKDRILYAPKRKRPRSCPFWVRGGETLDEHQVPSSDTLPMEVAEYKMELRNYQHVALSRARQRNVVMVGQ